MKIGFHTNNLSLRGTEIALYDYAFYNQTLLNNESLIFYKSQNVNDPSVVKKFEQHFKLCPYQNTNELSKLAEKEQIDLMYFIKSGAPDGDIIDTVSCAVHAVFPTNIDDFHGDRFAFVSSWLAKECSNNKVPFVPHMINLPEVSGDLRVELDIPKDATVLASYGGSDSFNLKFVHETILKVLSSRKDIYFLFMNFEVFAKHERLLFLPGVSDTNFKGRFINTADGMIHARGIGESFGLACGEFSIKNKPVITYALSPQRSHTEILGDKALLYKGKKDLESILLNFDTKTQFEKNWDAYSEYFSANPVMNQFENVFLKSPANNIDINWGDQMAVKGYRLNKKIRSLSRKLFI